MRFAISLGLVIITALTLATNASSSTIRVNAVPTRVTSERLPPGREGDVEWLRWSIRDRYGRTIGNAFFDCRWAARFTRLCYGEILMPLGSLALIGTSPGRDSGVYSVVGGTGSYVGESGEMTFFSTSIRRLSVVIELEGR